MVPIRKPFDRPDRRAISLVREHEARSYRPSIHDHRTSPAHAVLAANMRTRKSAIVPNGVNQSFAMFDDNLVFATIYDEAQGILVHYSPPSRNGLIARDCGLQGAPDDDSRQITAIFGGRRGILHRIDSV